MPGVNDFNGNWLPNAIANALADIRAMQTQQQTTLSNGQGQPIMNFGLIPGSNPPAYGMQMLNPANGSQAMFVGEDGAGNAYLAFYNSSGQMLSKFDQSGIHMYNVSGVEIITIDQMGFHVNNTSAQEEARLGLLNSSPAIYGLGVAPSPGSTLQQVAGVLNAFTSTTQTTTSTTWTTFGDEPAITTTIGPSGQAFCAVGAFIGTPGSNEEGAVGLSIDGANPPGSGAGGLSAIVSGASAVASNSYNARIITGLTPGSHTFSHKYEIINAGAGNCAFSNRIVIVQPL